MKKIINFLGIIIFLVLVIACEKDEAEADEKDQTGLALIEGTYYEQNHYYRHIKIIDSGNMAQVYVVADQPDSYCRYENRGILISNPSTGFVVEGKWYQFYPLDTWCGSSYRVVQQKDNNTIVIRSYANSYESAYALGTSVTFKK